MSELRGFSDLVVLVLSGVLIRMEFGCGGRVVVLSLCFGVGFVSWIWC